MNLTDFSVAALDCWAPLGKITQVGSVVPLGSMVTKLNCPGSLLCVSWSVHIPIIFNISSSSYISDSLSSSLTVHPWNQTHKYPCTNTIASIIRAPRYPLQVGAFIPQLLGGVSWLLRVHSCPFSKRLPLDYGSYLILRYLGEYTLYSTSKRLADGCWWPDAGT